MALAALTGRRASLDSAMPSSPKAASPSSTPTKPKAGLGASIRTAGADLMTSAIASSVLYARELPMEGATVAEKEKLSVQSTTINFRNFVAKSGPIFWFQDRVEAVLSWEDPAKTLFWATVWATMCLYPVLFLIAPEIIVISILLRTYSRRFPPAHEPDLAARDKAQAPKIKEISEGSVDYVANLQNIQIMMGRISMGSDLLRANVVPLLNWSDPKASTVILHLSFLAAGATVLVYHYVPWNFVLLAGGVGGIFAAHPWFLSLLGHLERSPEHRSTVEAVKRTVERIIANDALPDDVLDAPHLVTIRCVEHERFREGTWSHDHLDAADPPAWSKLEGHGAQGKRISGAKDVVPSPGFEWIEGEGWLIDFAHRWGREGIDPEGWTVVGPPSLGPSLRQRRWMRRAFDKLPPV